VFDISFTELLIIGVIALVVIGPERLPKVARTVGHLLGRAQRYVSDVKGDIQREVELDELKKMKAEMEDAARDVTNSMQETEKSIRGNLDLKEEDGFAENTYQSITANTTTTSTEAVTDASTAPEVSTPSNISPQDLALEPSLVPTKGLHAEPSAEPAPAPNPAATKPRAARAARTVKAKVAVESNPAEPSSSTQEKLL